MEGVGSTLLCLGVLFLLGFPLLSYAFFWYEAANSPYKVTLKELSGGKTGRWLLAGYLSSVLSLTLIILLYLLGLRRKLQRPVPQPDTMHPPVILVHGLYHNAGAWTLFRRRLQRAGFANIYPFQYNSWTARFEDILKNLERYVEEVETLFPGRKVVLVGHSLGGLLCRALMEGPTGHRRNVLGLITLGTPHHGSKLAALGPGSLSQHLTYRGAIVTWIERNTVDVTARPAIPKMALYSPIDNMVLPHDALFPHQRDWELFRTAPICHVHMLFNRKTALQAIQCISQIEEGVDKSHERPRSKPEGGRDD